MAADSEMTGDTDNGSESKPSRARRASPLLFEIAWEACNKLGGIYTVLRSKAPSMVDQWGSRYCLIGPYNPQSAAVEFEGLKPSGAMRQVLDQLADQGITAHYGRWIVTGRPHVVLLDYHTVFPVLHEVKYRLWKDHGVELPGEDDMLNSVVAFGEVCRRFLQLYALRESSRRKIVAHFHEWMAGVPVPMLRRERWPGSIVFTTHATILGRFLAMNDPNFYEHLNSYNADREAAKFCVEPQHRLERAAAHGAHVFTTVSDVTGEECRALLKRAPDRVLPNGLNIQRFAAWHEFQNLHRQYKDDIHRFTIGHFFPSYHFDLDKTIYLFTSGRYEYRNKGMDMTIESLARLNSRLQRDNPQGTTVVAFIITRRPTRSINVEALHSNAMLREFRTIADAVKDQVGEELYREASRGKIPDLNSLADEYWLLRLRRAIHAWRRDAPPGIVTHDLVDDRNDEVLNQLRMSQLWNQAHDPVKVIYHPDFIDPSNPLFGLEYDQFVRGCNLGIFPSYYEPWGYTPLESIALGVPAVTSDLAGFGSYVSHDLADEPRPGLTVIERRHASYEAAVRQLTDYLYDYARLTRRDRIAIRNAVESFSDRFGWRHLASHYHDAHQLAMDRTG